MNSSVVRWNAQRPARQRAERETAGNVRRQEAEALTPAVYRVGGIGDDLQDMRNPI
jgi:hypothetical protein